VPEITSAT